MGRRSITGTKAGKFMNPTDQARKEARRKELKKNKKQRLQVRQAVIKQKDPKIIFAEMEAIDKMGKFDQFSYSSSGYIHFNSVPFKSTMSTILRRTVWKYYKINEES